MHIHGESTRGKRRARTAAHGAAGRRGSVMLELVLCMPVILVLILACVQMTMLCAGRMMVHYAAYAAARAAMVSHTSEYDEIGERVAEKLCAWINLGDTWGIVLPGWGNIGGSGGVEARTDVSIREIPEWNVRATVEHQFACITPIVGPLLANLNYDPGNGPWYKTDEWGYPFPTIKLKESVCIPKPFVTVTPTEW